ncbi:hypothetical protein SAMN04487983_10699 [Streptomyces sp. yr375]|uniref:hypothetical protein n=1 Tax=Streptomyces sp. yr375 TaxID=1761906 RepID=UPI0008BF7A07|nr:hypothetical protein [Streptomyces sp. yr375]SES48497.1 hypothetical protein SAMN04487983_10699 [Streptomyces sp. yr375]
MTTTAPAEPFTVRAFLLGPDCPDTADALAGPLHSAGAANELLRGTRPLPPAADQAVEHELAGSIGSFLSLDVFDVAAGGWRRHAALTEAARRTRAAPGSEEVVALASHEITSNHHPYVDVFLDGAKVGTLDVWLDLFFRISGLVTVVRDAHVVAVRSGQCVLEARLAVQQIPLAERQGRLDLPGIWHLHTPLPLLKDQPPPPHPPPPPPPPGPPSSEQPTQVLHRPPFT